MPVDNSGIIFPTTGANTTWTAEAIQRLTAKVNTADPRTNIVYDTPETRFIPVQHLDLSTYSEAELILLRDRIQDLIGPRPPKFKTEAEAEAWLEKNSAH